MICSYLLQSWHVTMRLNLGHPVLNFAPITSKFAHIHTVSRQGGSSHVYCWCEDLHCKLKAQVAGSLDFFKTEDYFLLAQSPPSDSPATWAGFFGTMANLKNLQVCDDYAATAAACVPRHAC